MYINTVFLDKRTKEVGAQLFNRMIETKRCSIRGLSTDKKEQKRYYRWLHHQQVTKEKLINATIKETGKRSKDRHVLAIQDTSELNYQSHAKRVQGLGTVGNGTDLGMFIHPLLTLDAETGEGLGFGAIKMWNRFSGKQANYAKLPIEEKESYRWLETAEQGKKNLASASCVTFVGDRENDIYEFLARTPEKQFHVLVRSRGDRRLSSGEKLHERLQKQAIAKRFKLNLPATKKRAARVADIELRYTKISIKRPSNVTAQTAPSCIELYAVEAKEVGCHKDAIHWCLLTTHEVNDVEMAENIVQWYRQRWQIEQLFRTLKSEGLDIESSQLEKEASLTRLVIVALNAALLIMQLVLAREGDTQHRTDTLFNQEKVEFLKRLLPTLEGKTLKQKNPYPPSNLGWASWVIGRLGGWKGYRSEGPAGPVVMGRGLRKFYAMMEGFTLYRNLSTQ